jgi:hypothetical protein
MASSKPMTRLVIGSLIATFGSFASKLRRNALSVIDRPEAASANPKDFYDNRFLQELESSSFVKELYAGN